MLQPGAEIDIWVVEKALGSGGMGSVYRCHNVKAARILAAVKVLDANLEKIPGAADRFVREAEILFQLDHPNIVKVRNIRVTSTPHYLEMEFVEGKSLEDLLEANPNGLPLQQAIDITCQLLDAAAYLHARGIRHRDIKPANVLIRADGTAKLVDFGLAMEADVTRITQSGTTFGTVSYAPPEWVQPDQLDPVKWDIYAIGVVAWEMLTGAVAFPVSGQGNPRQQAMQVMLNKVSAPALDPWANDARKDTPEILRDLIMAMTQPKAEVRARDAWECLEKLLPLHPKYRPHSRSTDRPAPPTPPPAPTATGRKSTEGSRGEAPSHTWNEETPPADTLAPKTVTAPPSSRGRLVVPLLVAGIALVGAIAVVAGASLLGAWVVFGPTGEPVVADRDVDVVVSGIPSGVDLTLVVDGASPVAPSSRDGWVYHFRDLTVGPVLWKAAVGAGCDACVRGGSCPEWCGVQTHDGSVEPGDGLATVPLTLAPPSARPIRAKAAKLAPDTAITVTIQGRPVDELLPGRYAVEASAAGAAPWAGELVVPWGTGPATLELPLAPAAPPADPTKAKVDPPKTDPAKVDPPKVDPPKVDPPKTDPAKVDPPKTDPGTPAAASSGRLVTNGDFARWLGSHPEFHRDAAIASKFADDNYLSGWSGVAPAAGTESGPAVNVSYIAAAAYCKSKGGVAAVEAEPVKWTESAAQPAYEWRLQGTKAVFLDATGVVVPAQRVQSNVLTGFRCAR